MNDRFKFRIWVGKQFLYTTPHEDSWYNEDNQAVWKKHVDVEQMFPDIQPCSGIKDKSGKLIFQGDICEVEVLVDKGEAFYLHEMRTGVVRVMISGVRIKVYKVFDVESDKPVDSLYSEYTTVAGYRTKVIGNIYQHKHLLE